MRLGISSYTYGWSIGVTGKEPQVKMNAESLLEEAIHHDIHCVQIADNLPLHLLPVEERRNLKQKAIDNGIAIEVGTRGLQPENLSKYIEIADFFNSPILRVVIDTQEFIPGIPEIINILEKFRDEFIARKIKLAIENHDRLKAREFSHIVEKAGNDWVGICLDSVNSMGAGEGLEEVFRILGPNTINFHIKDFTIRRIWHMMGFQIEGLPAGQGMLPIRDLINTLEDWGKCESGILELWTPQQNTIEETVRMERSWAGESIAYLKNIF